ncbi:hypothetical protein PR202_gb10856 [Eleusine coracana subsp. coracana]|uniref:Uncharacterized protein n=1 Tax=Eleusine coracana subsp. coracana TaxID=191504 RepID=A0AAV5EL22_ELECO|nr:hypothetical protein PR202_gb10856 [Eleusine coracana subsp. coracana]
MAGEEAAGGGGYGGGREGRRSLPGWRGSRGRQGLRPVELATGEVEERAGSRGAVLHLRVVTPTLSQFGSRFRFSIE